MITPKYGVVAAGLVLLTGCTNDPAAQPTPLPISTVPNTPAPTNVPEDPPPPSTFMPSKIVKDDKTFWLSMGGFPRNVIDNTTARRTATRTFRFECDRGSAKVEVSLDGAPLIWEHSCADGILTAPLGTIKVGTKIRIAMEGTAGSSYVADIR